MNLGSTRRQHRQAQGGGLFLGFIAVVSFSLTLPATRFAVAHLDPTFVGLGRALFAALLAAPALLLSRQRFPSRRETKGLMGVVAGVVIGFPLFSAWAMNYVHASHGAVVLGILPLATAVTGAVLARERPSVGFWLFALLGTGLVSGFAVIKGEGEIRLADLALVGAVGAAALGYTQGARLARTLGEWQVISWALVFTAPFLVVPVILTAPVNGVEIPFSAWLGFAYLCVVSQYIGFFPWYRALARGGIARVSQIQLLQPFLTMTVAAIALNELIDGLTVLFAALVVAVVAIGRTRSVRRADDIENSRT